MPASILGSAGLLQRILLAVAFAWHIAAGYRLTRQAPRVPAFDRPGTGVVEPARV